MSPALPVPNTASEMRIRNKNYTNGARNHGEWRAQIFLKSKPESDNVYTKAPMLMEKRFTKGFCLGGPIKVHLYAREEDWRYLCALACTEYPQRLSLHAESFFVWLLPHQSKPIWCSQFVHLSNWSDWARIQDNLKLLIRFFSSFSCQ